MSRFAFVFEEIDNGVMGNPPGTIISTTRFDNARQLWKFLEALPTVDSVRGVLLAGGQVTESGITWRMRVL